MNGTAAPGDDLGFTHRVRKDGDVEILHHGALAATLRGAKAAKFLDHLLRWTPSEAQRSMARLTGNYKRGNERDASRHPRNRG